MTSDLLKELLSKITYKHPLRIGVEGKQSSEIFFEHEVPDCHDPDKLIRVTDGPHTLPDYAEWQPTDLYRWVFDRIRDFEAHEAAEFFRVAGLQIYHPHTKGNRVYGPVSVSLTPSKIQRGFPDVPVIEPFAGQAAKKPAA